LEYGFTDKAKETGEARFIRITDIDESGKLKNMEQKFIDLTSESKKYLLKKGDVLVARTGATYGKTVVFRESYPAVFASYLIKLSFNKEKVLPDFYWIFAQSDEYWKQAKNLMTGGGQQQFNANAIKKIRIPVVPLEVQKQLIEEMKTEEEIIAANRQLIEVMERKIGEVLSEV
jgi:restriction endonuclease S subunit